MLSLQDDVLSISLPEGKTQQELVELLKSEVKRLESEFYGKDIKINGRITTAMALYLGHALAHVAKSVSIFDPKENAYVLVITH